jgi:hypothetical protein
MHDREFELCCNHQHHGWRCGAGGNQEQRIQQGVNSGQVTPREAGRLDAQQARIQQQESRMKSDGQLTGRERAKLTREQNRASRNIYRKKHNVRNVNTN